MLAAIAAFAQSRPASAPSFESSDAIFEDGCARLKAGDAAGAVQRLTEALARRPESAEYALRLAEAQRLAGRAAEAARLLEAFIGQHGASTALRVALARAKLEAGDAGAAVAILQPHQFALDRDGVLALCDALRATRRGQQVSGVLRSAVQRHPRDRELWLAYAEAALDERQYATALSRVADAARSVGPRPEFRFVAARAYFGLGQFAGATQVRSYEQGRAGQFAGEWLLIEPAEGAGQFVCAPRESALYQIRAALDGGLQSPEARLLHGQVWARMGRPEVGLRVLQSVESELLDSGDGAALRTLEELALAAGALHDYQRYNRLRAERDPERRTAIQLQGFRNLAERYNQRGEPALCATFLRRALELAPGDVGLCLQAADAEWELGRTDEAALLYRKVLEDDPLNAQRLRILDRLNRSAP